MSMYICTCTSVCVLCVCSSECVYVRVSVYNNQLYYVYVHIYTLYMNTLLHTNTQWREAHSTHSLGMMLPAYCTSSYRSCSFFPFSNSSTKCCSRCCSWSLIPMTAQPNSGQETTTKLWHYSQLIPHYNYPTFSKAKLNGV